MIHYRKILELRAEGISHRGIATSTNHSRQKVTEIIDLAEKKEIVCPFVTAKLDSTVFHN